MQGRLLPWQQVSVYALSGRGTVIVESAQKCPARLWWTEDNVKDENGREPDRADQLSLVTGIPHHPFYLFCWSKYLNPDTGLASLIHPKPRLRGGGWEFDRLKAAFPEVRLVETVRLKSFELEEL